MTPSRFKATLVAALLAALPPLAAWGGNLDPAKPNVIIIYYDDMGYGDLGANDTTQTSFTPRLDTLAGESLRFTSGHSADAICTPSRYAFMTGRYCWRTPLKSGVTGGYSAPLMETERLTMGKMFQSKGYATAMVGKWHVGMQFYSPAGAPVDLDNDADVLDDVISTTSGDKIDFSKPLTRTPIENGFDYFFGTAASLDMPPYMWIENNTALFKGGMVTGGNVDFSQAVPATNAVLSEGVPVGGVESVRSGVFDPNFNLSDYLQVQARKVSDILANRAADGQPFFIYVPMPAPHKPWAEQAAFASAASFRYGRYLAQTDYYTGVILDALANPDGNPATADSLAGNTVVFISSDNGPEKAAFTQSQSNGHDANGPFRGIKRDNWEGGTRVPFMIRWPGKVTPGISNHPCWQGDFFATMAAYLGYDISGDQAPDAESFLPVLLGNPMPTLRREGLVQHSALGQLAIVDKEGVWKLLDGTGSGGYPDSYDSNNNSINGVGGTIFGNPKQLFNLSIDPGENTNLLLGSPSQAALNKQAELYSLLNSIRGNTGSGTDGNSNVPPADNDADDMSNAFENSYQLNRDDPSDRNLDLEPDGLTNVEEYQNGANPRDADTDDDRLGDFSEVHTYGTLVASPHSDPDTLPDGDEVLVWDTNPLLADSDADGVSDDIELASFSNPRSSLSVPMVSGSTGTVTLSPSAMQLAGVNGTSTNPALLGGSANGWPEAGTHYVRERRSGGSDQQMRTRMFLRFDLASIPGTVTHARLRLHQRHRLNSVYSGNLAVARVTDPWTTTSGSYPTFNGTGVADSFIFGNNADFGTALNASGFYSGTPGVVGTDSGFDVTAMVQAWVAGSNPNHGLRIAFETLDFIAAAFSATDDPSTPNQNEALQLIVSYSNLSYQSLDVDGDFLLDAYETAVFQGPGQTGAGDYDSDGRNNLLEQALGSNPKTGDAIPGFGLGTANSPGYGFAYHRYNKAGLGYEVQVSEDLKNWLPFTRFYQYANPQPPSELGADYDKVLLEPSSPLPEKLFYKVNIRTYTR